MKREVIRNEAGQPFSQWRPAEKFAYFWHEHGLALGEPEREFRFHAVRKWRFDFAWPELKLAVEIDGFGYGHQAQQNIAKQNEKQNAAIEMGWRVLRYDSCLLGSYDKVRDAVDQVVRVICELGQLLSEERN